jgi:hypothetical protein
MNFKNHFFMKILLHKSLLELALFKQFFPISRLINYLHNLNLTNRIKLIFCILFVTGVATVNGQQNCPVATHSIYNNFSVPFSSSPTTLWLNIHTQLSKNQLINDGDYILFSGGTLSLNGISASFGSSVSLPNGQIIADNSITTPYTSFNSSTNTWVTRVPLSYSSSDIFLSGAAITSNTGFNSSWRGRSAVLSGSLYCNKSLSSSWFFGIAFYQPTFTNENIGRVNVDNGIPENSLNTGTPIDQMGGLVQSRRNSGSTNYTGSYSSSDNFFACINTQPAAPIITLTQPTCSVNTGTITISSPVAAGNLYSIDGSTYQSGVTFAYLNPGTYNIYVMSSVGIVSPGTVAAINSQPPTPSAPDVTITQPICSIATGIITVTAPRGPGYSYSIDGSAYQPGNTFSGMAPGSYNVTVKNSEGCTSSATIVVINPQPPTPLVPDVTITQPTCSVATGTITVTAPAGSGYSYSIDDSAYQPGNTFSGMAPGSYNVTAKNSEGCTSSATIEVINPQPPTPSAPDVTITQPTCSVATGTISVTAPAGTGYSYSIDGSSYQSGNTFSNLTAGFYDVTVQNSEGCVSRKSDIIINPQDGISSSLLNGLISYWTLDEKSGNAIDMANGGNTGININVSQDVQGKINTAYAYNGISSATDMGNPSNLSLANAGSLSAWVYMPNLSMGQDGLVVGKGDWSNDKNGYLIVYLHSSQLFSAQLANANSSQTIDFNGVNITANNWYNLVLTWDGSNITTYLNGEHPTSFQQSVIPNSNISDFAIGFSQINKAHYFNGTIDEVGIWGRALTSTEVSEIYNNSSKNQYPFGQPTNVKAVATQPSCSVYTGTITIKAPTGTGYTYSINGATYQSDTTFKGLQPGSYHITAKYYGGCSLITDTTAIIIASLAKPATPIAKITQPTCSVSTGNITITTPNGTGYFYSIDGSTYQESNSFSGLTAGSYNLTAQNAEGCASYTSVAVINPQPTTPSAPSVTITQPTCSLATGAITVSAPEGEGYSYSINGSTYQPGNIFSEVASGSYNVTAQNTEGCASSESVVVINPQPTTPSSPSVTITQPTCSLATGAIMVSAPEGEGYSYSINGSIYQPGNIFSEVVAGSYNVTIQNAEGCSSSATFASVNPQPATPDAPAVALTQPSNNVITGTIAVTAPIGTGYTYSINGSFYQPATTFSNVAPGSYKVTAQNSAGCISATTTALINTQTSLPSVTISQPTCSVANGTITVTSPTGTDYTYSINGITFQASTTFSGVAPGSYTVTSKNTSGSISTGTLAVINPQPSTPIAPAVTITQPTCSVATGTISATAPTSNGYTYSIDGSTYQSGTTFNSVASGSYNVTVKNSAGCSSSATVALVNQQPATPIAPAVSLIQPTCSVTGGTIDVTAPTGIGYTYSIDGSTYQSGTTFNSVASGSYNVTVNNNTGCSSSATVALINPQPATPAAPAVTLTQPTCSVPTGMITLTSPTGTGYTFSIDGTNYQSGTTFSNIVTGSYNVSVKNAAGCSSSATAVVVNPSPATPLSPTVTLTQPTCSVNTGTLAVTTPLGTALSYSIDGINYQPGSVFSGLGSGSYDVTVKNGSGCISIPTVAIINQVPGRPAAPNVIITQPSNTESSGTISISAPVGIGYSYSMNGTNYQSSPLFSGIAPGTYYVTVRNASGCISNSTLGIINSILLTANAGPNQVLSLGTTSATLSGSGTGSGITFAWTEISGGSVTITSPSSANTTVSGLTGGIYTFQLTVTDNSGTIATSSVSVTVGTVLTIKGTITGNSSSTWNGVNIARNVPTIFSYLYNNISSSNTDGYLLLAGDENPIPATNNNLDGEVISGNYLTWNGTGAPLCITHGIFTGYNINALLTYNYLNSVPMSIIRKSNGMSNTSGGVAYNIVNNPLATAVVVKGMNNVNIFNNTFYSTQSTYNGSSGTWRGLVDIYMNTDITPSGSSTGTKIFNNIFYTRNQILNINLYETADLTGFQSDYNLFYCESGTPLFKIGSTIYTFSQWQALGYDTHSVVMNPNFNNFTDFVPAAPLNYGTNLGSTWQTGLAGNAVWSTTGMPATVNQGSTWQVGARIVNATSLPLITLNPNKPIISNKNSASVTAYPNPYSTSTKVNFNIKSSLSGRGSLAIFDELGRKLATVFEGDFTAGSEKTVSYKLKVAKRQPLVYIFTIGNKTIYGKLFPGD